jgi:hypothetical protein
MNAPDPETLRKLAQDLPGMISDLENQRALKGQKSAKLAQPTKCCEVCGKGFDFKMVSKQLPDLARCDSCTALLKEGFTAFVADRRFALVKIDPNKTPEAVNWVGKVIHTDPDWLDRLEIRYKAQILSKTNGESKSDK